MLVGTYEQNKVNVLTVKKGAEPWGAAVPKRSKLKLHVI